MDGRFGVGSSLCFGISRSLGYSIQLFQWTCSPVDGRFIDGQLVLVLLTNLFEFLSDILSTALELGSPFSGPK